MPATFTGTTLEYFRIYVSNVFLSIITAGIYSSWAKVRNRRYFYGHTSFAGHTLDFDAKPFAIFLARMLIFGAVIAVGILEENWNLAIGEVSFSFLLLIFLLPLLTVRGRAFNSRHTLLGGVRFRYAKRFLPSYLFLFCFTLPHLATLTLFLTSINFLSPSNLPWLNDWDGELLVTVLLYGHLLTLLPISHWWAHRIRINQLEFGKLQARFACPWRTYVRIYLAHLLALALLAGYAVWQVLKFATDPHLPYQHMLFLLLSFSLIMLSYLAHINRNYWNGIAFADGSRLQARFNALVFAYWITLVNWILNVVSLGLLIPRTRIRRWDFLARHITFIPSDELRQVLAAGYGFETAIGSEAIDLDGYDLDLALI